MKCCKETDEKKTTEQLVPDCAVTIAGIGPGHPDLMTEALRRVLSEADAVIGAPRMIEALKRISAAERAAERENSSKIYIEEYRPDAVAQYITEDSSGYAKRRYLVAVSGDSGFFSAAPGIFSALEKRGITAEILPGISSVSCLCAKAGVSYEDVVSLSAHGRETSVASCVRRSRKTFLLTGNNGAQLLRRLVEFGLGDVRVIAGERLSCSDQRITEGRVSEMACRQYSGLTSMLLINPDPKPFFLCGMADDCFLRGSVPMTKREIRAQVMSLLRLREDSVAYDIGAGTGSVTVEMALTAWRGHVFAVEKKSEGVSLIRQNCRRFSTDNVTIVEGEAPEALKGLPAPDTVFIGGAGGKLDEIFEFLRAKAAGKPSGEKKSWRDKNWEKDSDENACSSAVRLVMTAVTLETIGSGMEKLETYGFEEVQVVQIAAARGEKVGGYHLLKAQSPVFVLSGVLRR